MFNRSFPGHALVTSKIKNGLVKFADGDESVIAGTNREQFGTNREVSWSGAVGMLKAARDANRQRIVAKQLMEALREKVALSSRTGEPNKNPAATYFQEAIGDAQSVTTKSAIALKRLIPSTARHWGDLSQPWSPVATPYSSTPTYPSTQSLPTFGTSANSLGVHPQPRPLEGHTHS